MADKALQGKNRRRSRPPKSIAKLGTDTKAKKLVTQLKAAFSEGYDSAIVFTQYTDTMDFLKNFLAGAIGAPGGRLQRPRRREADAAGKWSFISKEQMKGCSAAKTVVSSSAPMPQGRA